MDFFFYQNTVSDYTTIANVYAYFNVFFIVLFFTISKGTPFKMEGLWSENSTVII